MRKFFPKCATILVAFIVLFELNFTQARRRDKSRLQEPREKGTICTYRNLRVFRVVFLKIF